MMEEVDAALVEAVAMARWVLVEAYHLLGTEIVENSKKYAVERREVCNAVATGLGKSQRSIYYAVEFAERYPNLNKVPGGKNLTWHKICNELLADGKKEECKCDKGFGVRKFCNVCGKKII